MRRQLLHGQHVAPPSPRRIVDQKLTGHRTLVARIPLILDVPVVPLPAAVAVHIVPALFQSAADCIVAKVDTHAAIALQALVQNPHPHPKVDASLVSKLCKWNLAQ